MSCVAGEEVGFGDDDRAEMRLMVIKQGMHTRMTPSPGPTSVPVAQEYLPATAAKKKNRLARLATNMPDASRPQYFVWRHNDAPDAI